MIKQFDRLQYMDYLIRIQGTGNLQQFATKLEISRSTCGEYLRILRDLGAEIKYCSFKKSYYYVTPVELIIGFKHKNHEGLLHSA